MKKKAIFLDIDRTLLNDDRQVPSENKKAVHAALDAGHMVILNTGRPVRGAMCVVEELELTRPGCYMLGFNGSVLYDCNKGENVYMECVDADEAIALMKAAISSGIHAHTYDETRIICPGPRDKELDFYRIAINIPLVENVPFDEMIKMNLLKVMLIDLDGQERMGEFRAAHPEFDRHFQNFFSAPFLLEYVRRGINKGAAVKMFCDYAGLDISDTIAMGDEENDIDMIQAAGLGVAMINAKDKVKASADIVTTLNNNEGGVAEIIRRFML